MYSDICRQVSVIYDVIHQFKYVNAMLYISHFAPNRITERHLVYYNEDGKSPDTSASFH